MCKSDDCIRLYFCIRFEFPLIFTDGFLISGGMGKCHNCKNSLKCVGFMSKNEKSFFQKLRVTSPAGGKPAFLRVSGTFLT